MPEETLSQNYACADCGTGLAEVTPRLFSFNSPYGACPTCGGLGSLNSIDPDKVITDPARSIDAGRHRPLAAHRPLLAHAHAAHAGQGDRLLAQHPLAQAPRSGAQVILWGTDHEMEFRLDGKKSSYSWKGTFEGVIPRLERRYKETDSALVRGEIERFMSVHTCPTCEGKRLKAEALAVTVGGDSIHDLSSMTVGALHRRFAVLEAELSLRERTIAEKILQEITDRLRFLEDVGVGYLSLDRTSASLSGGESQRIRLATQIGSKLMGVLYVLDEPSIGLHQRDNARLIATLKGMRDLGNSVLVVEHDEETILEADWVVDLGPGAGVHGGEVVAEGTPDELARHPRSLTGKYLRGEESIPVPARRRAARALAHGSRRAPQQPAGGRRGVSDRSLQRRHRRLRLGQEQPGRGRAAQGARARIPQRRRQARRARQDQRSRAPRQGHRHRPEPDRPHAAIESRDLHQGVLRTSAS